MGKPVIESPREQLDHDFRWFNRWADKPNPDRLLAERLAAIRRYELAAFERLWAEQATEANP